MKMLAIVCDMGLEERILAGLRRINVSGYTCVPNLLGLGRTGRRDNDPVWPGSNSMILVAMPDEGVSSVLEMLRRLKGEYLRAPNLHVFAWEAQDLL
jgi:hypothetical protein